MAPKRGAQPRPSETETTANDPRDECDVRSPPAKKASARIIAETAAAARPCTHCCTAVVAGATERRSDAAADRAVATAQSATQTAGTAQASAPTMAEQQQQQHAAQHIGAHAHTAYSNAECATPAARGLRHMMRSAERGRDADRTHQSDREESPKAQQDAAHNPVHTAVDEAHPHSTPPLTREHAGQRPRADGQGGALRAPVLPYGPRTFNPTMCQQPSQVQQHDGDLEELSMRVAAMPGDDTNAAADAAIGCPTPPNPTQEPSALDEPAPSPSYPLSPLPNPQTLVFKITHGAAQRGGSISDELFLKIKDMTGYPDSRFNLFTTKEAQYQALFRATHTHILSSTHTPPHPPPRGGPSVGQRAQEGAAAPARPLAGAGRRTGPPPGTQGKGQRLERLGGAPEKGERPSPRRRPHGLESGEREGVTHLSLLYAAQRLPRTEHHYHRHTQGGPDRPTPPHQDNG